MNNNEVSIPCSTLDEPFPFVFIASPISADEFEAISLYFAEKPRYFQHHSWIPALLTLPVDKCLHKSDAGPCVYHIRMRSWHPAKINQPRQEAGRIVVGRSNALRLLVYEHGDLVVFVPAGGVLLDLFDDPHSIDILRHRAIPKEEVNFDFTTRPDAVTSRSSLAPTQWTQNDFFHAPHSEHVEEEVIEHIPTVLDDVDDTTDTPIIGVNEEPNNLPTAAVGNQSNTVALHHTESIPLSQQPQSTDIQMNQGDHSSDDKQMPSTLQILLQAASSQVSDPGNGQGSVKPSGASKTVKGFSCNRDNRGESGGERLDNEASLAGAGKTIVPLALSTNKDSNMPSTTKEAMQEASCKSAQLVLQRIVEVKDFIAKDASLNAMSFTPTDIERAATFLLHLPDVCCFYVAATRLLSKAGWRKEHQLQDDDLQSFVLKEVAKGWTLAKGRHNSKFTRFHLALVLGAYSSLNPLCIDSVADAIPNIVAHMIPSYHNVFCAEVGHNCPTCSKSHKWFTPFFESTLESYDGIDEDMLPRIFLQCFPESESFPGGDACCISSNYPQVIQEASIKLVNLQFHRCELPNVSKYPVILGADPFVIDATTWIACSVVVHTLPNHFYILERLDQGNNAYNPSYFKHDNASGLQKGCVRVKAEDQIVAILFRKTEVKPLWPNAKCIKKAFGGPQDKANPGSCLIPTRSASSTKPDLDSAKSTKQAKKRSIPAGKLTSHVLQLSPLLNKKRRRSSNLKPNENSKDKQPVSIFSHEKLQSGVSIPVPDSDEELDHEQVQSVLHQHLQNADDPISQFSSPDGDHKEPSDYNCVELPSGAVTEGQCNQPAKATSAQTIEGEPLGSSVLDIGHHALDGTSIVSQPRVAVEEEPLGSFSAEMVNFVANDAESRAIHQPDLFTDQQATILPNWVHGEDTGPLPTPYALISLFDGCRSTFHILKDAIGYPPQVFIAAEWDQYLRAIVADALGLSLDNNWRVNKFHSKSIYVSDVDDLSTVVRAVSSLCWCIMFPLLPNSQPCATINTRTSRGGKPTMVGPQPRKLPTHGHCAEP